MRWARRLLLIAAIPASAHAQRLLVGEWTLDKSRSELSGRMRTNAASIDQSLSISLDSSIVCAVTTTSGGPLGRTESTERYVVDSVERSFQPEERVDSRNSTGVRASRWRTELRQMLVIETITRDIGGQRFTAKNTHTWQVSANTDTLVITMSMQGPRGTIPTRRSFVRRVGAKDPGKRDCS